LAIHPDTPISDDTFACTPGSNSGVGKKFLKANGQTRNAEARMQDKVSPYPITPRRIPNSALESDSRLGFAQASDAIAGLPLSTFLEQLHALETLQHIPFRAQRAHGSQTRML
jgi:hypothetical protein